MAEEMLDIVNEKDEVVGKKSRKEAHEKGLLHRVVHVVIENAEGKVLCLKRSEKAEVRPGFISNCAEHVKSGENLEDAAKRAPEEELGTKISPKFFGKIVLKDKNHNQIIECFKGKSDGPFKIDLSELQSYEFKEIWLIKKEIHEGKKYSPAFTKVLGEIYG